MSNSSSNIYQYMIEKNKMADTSSLVPPVEASLNLKIAALADGMLHYPAGRTTIELEMQKKDCKPGV
jgi:hypothetical protein